MNKPESIFFSFTFLIIRVVFSFSVVSNAISKAENVEPN